MNQRIYFDYAATTPVDPEVIKAMEPYLFERFGNPTSPHLIGREARKALEDARESVAKAIAAKPSEIVFTSGATESNNQALIGVARRLKNKGNHIIVSQIEHHSVLEPAYYLEKEGFKVSYLPVNSEGLIDPQSVKKALTEQTILISVMHANNEIGTVQPVAEISKIAKEKGVLFHIDAAQTLGHVPVNVNELGVDLLSFSAHKFYGPKGIGVLYVRSKVPVAPFILGGDQENNQRASTQNVAYIVGMAKALNLCEGMMLKESQEQSSLRDQLIEKITHRVDGVKVNGHRKNRIPNNAHFSFERLQGEALLMSLDMIGICASMGSACTSGAMEPSHVLRAIGLSDELALGSLRISLGRWTKKQEIDFFLNELPGIIQRLRI